MDRLLTLLHSLMYTFQSKAELLLMIAALEQQLTVFKKKQPRPKLTKTDRLFWVFLKRFFNEWKKVLFLVKPDTVVRWHKKGFKLYWKFLCKRGIGKGKPPIDKEIVRLIQRFTQENQTWKAPRIHGELIKLGFKVSERTVSRYLRKFKRTSGNPSSWAAFLRNQQKGIAAMDFFVIPTLFFKQLYAFFIISHDRRRIIHFSVTFHPTALWVSHQITETFSELTEIPKYMIHDNDSIFSISVKETLNSFGTKSMNTSIASPWQNGIAERWVGSCRRELLNHVIIFNERHLHQLLEEYVSYYNDDRTHYSLGKDPPINRPVLKKESGHDKVIAIPRVGGLHHKYVWKDAA